MFCYHCGAQLSEQHDFCTACGADVSLYKKIMYVANRFYNDGLEKATVRDLTGAITSLRQCLKFNKNHVEARNLLGLVYFETGEVVAAMSEWVISKNLRPEKNIADDYIGLLQSNASRLDALNQTIKKYNQAYAYCVQESKDLAVIQLKKVLSLNPKFIRAHQLLALLYMDSEQWERAQRELTKCAAIDRNNTMTLRYLKEVEMMLLPDENVKQPLKRKKEEAVRYQSDNEIIIQPMNVKEPKSGNAATLLNVGIGLVIGLAACYFLVVPAKVGEVRAEAQQTITEIANQSDAKTSRIQELEASMKKLQEENDNLNSELEGYVGDDGTLKTIDELLSAGTIYLQTQNAEEAATHLENIAASVNVDETSEAFQNLYQTLLAAIGPELATTYYDGGLAVYRNEDFTAAIEQLGKAVYYDPTNAEALYYLGQAYRRSGDKENAAVIYEKVIDLFPGTQNAANAQRYLEEMGQ
ncbi:MAG: tetratricopeptide repeat protein [Lachnospiraceae bacterium]|nr:tetratricopeptide repeat protein [Lachnospiraceae bacterium]